MSLPAQKLREITLQILYGSDMERPDSLEIVELLMGELAISKKNVRLAQTKVLQILEHLPQIDQLIASASLSYSFERIQKVTLAVLRLGVYELFFEKQLPHKVAIAEAIRLSRKFSTPESASFVNALLDRLYQLSIGQEPSAAILEHESAQLASSEERAAETALQAPLVDSTPGEADGSAF